jgi:protein TonB
MGRRLLQILGRVLQRLATAVGAIVLTAIFFLVVPLMQRISEQPQKNMTVRQMAVSEPPPPPPEQEKQEPEKKKQKKPELDSKQSDPLSLSELEMSLNAGMGGGGLAGSLDVNVAEKTQSGNLDQLFSMAQLDQKPRPTYQPSPRITDQVRRHAPGQAKVIFIVNKQGEVEKTKVQEAGHPALAEAARKAVQKWRFEPGKREGDPVRFRMRVPVKFPKM